ncbi:uncharacterized protein LOC116195990 [Punica granatum]|nr:uncharacterized protein LOC116195990 [Punica granatum]OWM75566.1 hypothetical protein CDL15_Pgr021730 [Punica granatum]
MDVKLEEVEINDDAELLVQKGPEDHGCIELGERVERIEERCTTLECEIERVNGNCKALEAINRALEVEKHEIGTELLDLRRENREPKGRIAWLENERKGSHGKDAKPDALSKFVDLTAAEEEEDTVFQLMIENKALECEKQKAERDAEFWKGKFEELVLWVSQKDEQILEELFQSPDFPGLSLRKEIMDLKKKLCGAVESNLGAQVRRQLVFEAEDGTTRKISPSTPGITKPVITSTINIYDSDDDVERDTVHRPSYTCVRNQGNSKSSDSARDISSVPTPKRKRATRVVSSDSDSDDDDHVPISRLKKLHVSELSNNGAEHSRVISTTVEVDEDDDSELEDVESDSEGESLDGFIVSDGDDASTGSEAVSDSETDFEDVISTIRRKRDCKSSEWKFEGDMLAAFGKVPELCMKAVCALYRQQTADERVSKETFYCNGRGFSKFDALRGSNLGHFLTEGDPEGDLKKSVEELKEHDPKAVELCRSLATHYSKQLFEIYQKKEDPLFLPH